MSKPLSNVNVEAMAEEIAETVGECFSDELERLLSREHTSGLAWQEARLRIEEAVHEQINKLLGK